MFKSGNADARSGFVRRDLKAILGDGLGYSLMVGLGETYIPAFALALGMSEVTAGWIVSLPLLAGALLQLISPWGVLIFGSHRKWVVACAVLQAVSLFALMAEAWRGYIPAGLVFLTVSVYWGANLATGPAWNTWIGKLVPKAIRANFFARRSRGCQAMIMIGTVVGGLALQAGAEGRDLLLIFGILFLAAGFSRLVSALFLWSQTETAINRDRLKIVSPAELLRKTRRGSDGRLLLYLLVVQVAVQIAGPFFTPYMLGELGFSYLKYLIIICTAFAAKMIAFPYLGSVARKYGSHWLLYISGIGIIPLSALWIFSDNLAYILCIQVLGGVMWAGYELSTFLLFFEHIDESERTSLLTSFNLGNALALAAGALLGGVLLKEMGQVREAYCVIFCISGGARLLSLLLLARLRKVAFKPRRIATRMLGVRPNTGSIGTPIVSSLENDVEEDPM